MSLIAIYIYYFGLIFISYDIRTNIQLSSVPVDPFKVILPHFEPGISVKRAVLNKIDIFNKFNYEKGVCSGKFSLLIVLILTCNYLSHHYTHLISFYPISCKRKVLKWY